VAVGLFQKRISRTRTRYAAGKKLSITLIGGTSNGLERKSGAAVEIHTALSHRWAIITSRTVAAQVGWLGWWVTLIGSQECARGCRVAHQGGFKVSRLRGGWREGDSKRGASPMPCIRLCFRKDNYVPLCRHGHGHEVREEIDESFQCCYQEGERLSAISLTNKAALVLAYRSW